MHLWQNYTTNAILYVSAMPCSEILEADSVNAYQEEGIHWRLAAVFTMATLSSQAQSHGLIASKVLCAQSPLSQAPKHWAEILWQLVSSSTALLDNQCSRLLTLYFTLCSLSGLCSSLSFHLAAACTPSGSKLFWWHIGSEKQQLVSVLWILPWLILQSISCLFLFLALLFVHLSLQELCAQLMSSKKKKHLRMVPQVFHTWIT